MVKQTFYSNEVIRIKNWLEWTLTRLDPKKKYRIEIKEHKEKRSNDANAYFWVLADKLAEKLMIPKTEIYRGLVKEIGGVSVSGCFKTDDVKELCRLWEKKGLGWIAEAFDSKLPGCTNITFYKGSSEYDTAQMSRLIELVVSECDQQDIETKTPEEIARMVDDWG